MLVVGPAMFPDVDDGRVSLQPSIAAPNATAAIRRRVSFFHII
jgi:hypothetical protein